MENTAKTYFTCLPKLSIGLKVGTDKLNGLHQFDFHFRFLIVLATAAICWSEPLWLPQNAVAGVMMVLAQGHFILSYAYQYRSGKIGRMFLIRYLVAAFVILYLSFYFIEKTVLEAITAAYFVVHFFYDERFLLREVPSSSGWMTAVPTIIILQVEVLNLYAPPVSQALLLGAFLVGAIHMLLAVKHLQNSERSLTLRNGYFLLIFVLAAILTLAGKVLPGPANRNAINFVILVHFFNWYWYYFAKFHSNVRIMRRFILEAVSLNAALAIIMWFLVSAGDGHSLSDAGVILFVSPYFHIWTLLHYVATSRFSDLGNWRLA